tara:strand:- start:3984 stop:5006 length:1023 start_codon:yes stop_codon:yes gene_type:complete
MKKVNALIAGSTGYIGLQLVKLLLKHKNVKIKFLCGNSSKGKNIYFYDKDLKNKKLPKIIKFKKNLLSKVDVIFTALPNGESQIISKLLLKNNVLIDLSADFRLNKAKDYLKWYKIKHRAKQNINNSIYALPEIKKNIIKNYNIISCPGCYPTSALLPLIPLLKKKLINSKNIIIDSKSGYSGGGRGIHKKYKNHNLYNSFSAYGVGFHRHNSEIQQELNIYSKKKVNFSFTPHLSPMFRGILSTIYIEINKNTNASKILNYLKYFYKNEKFVKIMKINNILSTNDVINTNYCNISVCKTKFHNKLIILSALDNLIKGGAGQAVQNLNIRYDFNKFNGLI